MQEKNRNAPESRPAQPYTDRNRAVFDREKIPAYVSASSGETREKLKFKRNDTIQGLTNGNFRGIIYRQIWFASLPEWRNWQTPGT